MSSNRKSRYFPSYSEVQQPVLRTQRDHPALPTRNAANRTAGVRHRWTIKQKPHTPRRTREGQHDYRVNFEGYRNMAKKIRFFEKERGGRDAFLSPRTTQALALSPDAAKGLALAKSNISTYKRNIWFCYCLINQPLHKLLNYHQSCTKTSLDHSSIRSLQNQLSYP